MVSSGSHQPAGSLGQVITFSLAALTMIYLSYALPKFLPGDFVTATYASANVTLTAEQEAGLRAYYTQDEGFGDYLIRLVTLDWGYSYAFLTPVSDLFLGALPWTLLLLGAANLISMFIGFVIGVEAAWRHGSRTEIGLVGGMTVLEGIPEMCTGVILLVVFALNLQWFPGAGAVTAYAEMGFFRRLIDIAYHLTLPLTTLVLAYFPGNFLLTRNSMMMVIKAHYIETARAKGLPPRRIRYAHAARNALQPIVTRFGLRLAFMITGALVVERINSYPGLGTLLFNAIQARDLPVIQAVVLFSSLIVLGIILGMEGVYRIIDPRIRHAR
ncbi:MAG: ABC transporter permease [Deltaproteobacteria bacterium]|nr:ABC transporter permease [Deltaproteobacteria bacterium]